MQYWPHTSGKFIKDLSLLIYFQNQQENQKRLKETKKYFTTFQTLRYRARNFFSEIKILSNYVYIKFEVFSFIRLGTLYCLVWYGSFRQNKQTPRKRALPRGQALFPGIRRLALLSVVHFSDRG